MRLPLLVAATIVSITAGIPANANLTDYLAARKQFTPRAGVTLATVHADPARYLNVVVELRGIVAGVSRSDAGSNLLLRVNDKDVQMLHGSVDAVLPSSGESIRALATVEAGGELNLLSAVTEAEIGDTVIDAPKSAPKPASRITKSFGKTKLPVRWPVAMHGRSSVASRAGGIDPRVLGLYKQVIQQFNPRLSEAQSTLMAKSIVESSYDLGVDARFIMSIFATESGFKIKARSRCGAMGIGQLMPGTARSLGVRNAYDPVENIQGAVRLLQKHWLTYSQQTNDFGRFVSLVSSAYNAGPGAVKKYGGVPPYRETQQYVQKVARWYAVFAPELFR